MSQSSDFDDFGDGDYDSWSPGSSRPQSPLRAPRARTAPVPGGFRGSSRAGQEPREAAWVRSQLRLLADPARRDEALPS